MILSTSLFLNKGYIKIIKIGDLNYNILYFIFLDQIFTQKINVKKTN